MNTLGTALVRKSDGAIIDSWGVAPGRIEIAGPPKLRVDGAQTGSTYISKGIARWTAAFTPPGQQWQR